MKFFKFLSLLFFFSSCASKHIVSYESAYKSCPVDTFEVQGSNGPVDIYMRRFKGLVGSQLPAFSGRCLDDNEINRTYFEGKVSILNFWFIGCKPCEAEMPFLNLLVEKYSASNINFLAIGLNSSNDIKKYLATKPFNFDHYANGESTIKDVFKVEWGFPTTIVVNQEMKIVHIAQGLGTIDNSTKSQKQLIRSIERALAYK